MSSHPALPPDLANHPLQTRQYVLHWLSILVLVLMLLVLSALRSLAVPDEGRYGEIGRWMLVSGDWLVPRLNGIPFFHKPPLLYWLEAISIWLFGPNEWSVRLVVALHAAMMLVVTYLALRRIASPQVAHTAVWMLGSSLSFMIGGQYVNHDMVVAAWISVALWCFSLALMPDDRNHAGLARAGFAACAMGVLAKGLIGLVLPGLVLLSWLVVTRQIRKVWSLPWVSGLLIFCGLTLPWFFLAQMQFDQLLHYMFVKQHLQRYTESTFNNVQPFWFYGVALALLFFPWLGFVLYQAIVSIKKSAAPLPSVASRASVLCWVWLITVFVFFSIPSSKLVGYMLPVMPAVAGLAAMGWHTAMARVKKRESWFALLCGVNLLLAAGANTAAERYTLKHSARDTALQFACMAQPDDTLYVVGNYPYDFPFYARTTHPMVIVQDWIAARQLGGDNWRSELFEGSDFDPATNAVLQQPQALVSASKVANNWLIAPAGVEIGGFQLVFRNVAWNLYRSADTTDQASAPKSPVAAQHEGLSRCNQQGNHEGRTR